MLQPTTNLVCEDVFLSSVGIPPETPFGVSILRFRYHQIKSGMMKKGDIDKVSHIWSHKIFLRLIERRLDRNKSK